MPNGRPQLQILLVDDDELTREVLTLQMTAQGYDVHATHSGEAALDHLRQSPRSQLQCLAAARCEGSVVLAQKMLFLPCTNIGRWRSTLPQDPERKTLEA